MAYVLEKCRESGYPTSIEWSGDEVDFGSLQFPKPKKYEFLEMVIYVHEASFVYRNFSR